MVYTDLTAYILAKECYDSSSYSITKKGVFFHVKGGLVPEKVWKEHNPKPVYTKVNDKKGQNPCKKYLWMQ